MITFENVNKFTLSDITLHVPEGECVGLIGTSGAGKTTLIKLACGLLVPDSGYVRTMGKEPFVYRGHYGGDFDVLMTGVPSLDKDDTVLEGFSILKEIYGLSKERFEKDYKELSRRFGFAEYETEKIGDLSLGQRRRVELGDGFLKRPKLWILDEPEVGLDENAKAALGEILSERCKEGMTVLISSHNLSEISRVCSRIVLLEEGKMVFYGSEDRLRKNFAPIDSMIVKLSGKLPDLEDLPLKKYEVENHVLRLSYNSNHITAAEIIGVILQQTEISEIKIHKPNLEDILMQIRKEG